jgi:hypothetical protein
VHVAHPMDTTIKTYPIIMAVPAVVATVVVVPAVVAAVVVVPAVVAAVVAVPAVVAAVNKLFNLSKIFNYSTKNYV